MTISATIMSFSAADATAATDPPMVRIAEIEVDPAQLAAYKVLLKEEQETSVRIEPGVIMLHSVAIADRPTNIRLLEVYADRSAYEAHIRSPHFVKYKTSTERMVKSLKLIETTPILLCAKVEDQVVVQTTGCR
jgi:quinol monooxygenase YgiN